MSQHEPLKELEEVLVEEVREHTHLAEEESRLAERALEKLEQVRKEEEEERRRHVVTIVVDGEPVELTYKEQEIVGDLIPRALEKAGHVYKKEDRWQLKYDGKVLDLTQTMRELKLPPDATLFLSLEAGTLG